MALCQKIWAERKEPQELIQSLFIPLPKKGNLNLRDNRRTISLISHHINVMLRIIHNRLKSKTEEVLAEEQAGYRAERSTVEHILNCRIGIWKHLQHHRKLLHIFIDFEKAFDRVSPMACYSRIQHWQRVVESHLKTLCKRQQSA
ncbi:uncharacterized protein LOC127870146 [Dreissena polymorpha]|uniref:uncharacterized protein LOC127870146 n=1 Tax=Dreissena polymorpha TaxID=45954 RepID=UPI0022647C4F|nr:uncharacterized protein LOC127870146 [Dreissena polymorpha]